MINFRANGYITVTAAYIVWGILPVYWKMLSRVFPLEVLAHRIVWSVVFLFLIILYRRSFHEVKESMRSAKNMKLLSAASVLVGINWYLYIWAVCNNNLVEISLGYFICPLFSILLGMALFHEKLRKMQWAALFLALCGIMYLTISYGKMPLLALSVAITFALYGAVKKQVSFSAVTGLFTETAFLFLPALIYVIFRSSTDTRIFLTDIRSSVLLAGAGIATSIPLLLFAAGARMIPLSSLGFIQYLSPVFQLSFGVLVYKEDFASAKLIAFSLVWLALIIFVLDSVRYSRKIIPAVS